MSLLAVPILALLAFFLVIINSFVFYILFFRLQNKIRDLTKKVNATELFISELQLDSDILRNSFADVVQENEQSRAGKLDNSKKLAQSIQTLQRHFNNHKEIINQLRETQLQDIQGKDSQNQDNQGHNQFYNRAFNLAGKGASIDEIMSECDLPLAEVEMLMSVYHQRRQ
jgi:hypothetical protein